MGVTESLNRSNSTTDFERIYTYEGSTNISNIELNLNTTTAIIKDKSNIELDKSVLLDYIYSNNNEVMIKYQEFFNTHGSALGPSVIGNIGIKIYFEDGSIDEDIICVNVTGYIECLAEGTQITLADRKTKAIEDITYDDELLVWDFDKGEFATAKPLWLSKVKSTYGYNLLKFENGSELKTIEQHRIFNKEKCKFTYPMTDETPIGTTTFTDAGTETKLISKEFVEESVNYYNIISDYHINVFANGILTSCRFSNLYKIKDMKYEKDNRKLATKEEYPNIPEEYFKGLRLAEQPREVNRDNDVHHGNSIAEHILEVYIKNKK